MGFCWQEVANQALIALIVENWQHNPVVHRSAWCVGCGRSWYVVDYVRADDEGDVDEDAATNRRQVCLPQPLNAKLDRRRWTKKKVRAS